MNGDLMHNSYCSLDQIYLFRHFNLLLESIDPAVAAAFTPHALDPIQQLPLAVQSAFLLAVPIDQLHVEIQHVLYTQTLTSVGDAGMKTPECVCGRGS
jgi:hypothetical protein